MIDVALWLEERGLGACVALFSANDVDFEVLEHLTDLDLKELGISFGYRKKLLKELSVWTENRNAATAQREKGPVSRERLGPERRHLTVMFCDLLGSTALSQRLDPEDLREVISAYQSMCSDVVNRFGGFIAKYMGDGVLIYFGYPKADEDDAERAVHAGLALLQDIGKIQTNFGPLEIRVGIASGLVVVGDLVGEGISKEEAVVGETPNLAARLQALAEPNSVVIAPQTYRLLGDVFEYVDLGARELKGFSHELRIRRVVRAKASESQFEAMRAATLTPFVGRDVEMSMLVDRWQQAIDGEGQVVLLCGEAGMGKSRISQALHEHIASQLHTRLRYQCSPYFANTAFYPFVDQIERVGRLARDDPIDVKLDKLEKMFALTGVNAEELQLLAAMLSIPTGNRYPPLEMSPQRQKEQLIGTIARQITKLSSQAPILLVFEDAHWSDPTSIDALGAIIENIQTCRVLALVTYRPEFKPMWGRSAYVTSHTINRLARRFGSAMVERITGGKTLPDDVLAQIVAKTDGVPLFVEELTKTVLESGLLIDKGDHYELEAPLPPLAIPATLHDSLMARLDRLAPVKETAQIGAALGREFSYELISTISPLRGNELEAALAQLVASELIYQRGTPPETVYAFKHALVQDAAYESLLKSRRQQLHIKIAKTLEERFPQTVKAEPELVAHHYTVAGLAELAISYWAKAGTRALENSAYVEAVAHLRKGLGLVSSLPKSSNPPEQELMLLNLLATPLMYTKGYAAPEAGQVYGRAHELCQQVGASVHIFQAQCGVSTFHMVRGELERSLALAEEMLTLAERQNELGPTIEAHRLVGLESVYCGKFRKALPHLDRVRDLFDPSRHRHLALVYGQDHRMSSCVITSQALAALGYPEQARRWRREALAEAQKTDHYFSRAYARSMSLITLQYLRDMESIRDSVDDAIRFSAEQSISYWLTFALLFRGWLLVQEGKTDEAITQLRSAFASYRATGSELMVPHYNTTLAQALAQKGRIDEALEVLDGAVDQVERWGERHYEVETHRVKGDVLLACNKPDLDGVEQAYLKAVEVARRQDAKLFELRAATSLARLWHRRGKSDESRQLLNSIYGWFTEGFNSVDLKDARAALAELQS